MSEDVALTRSERFRTKLSSLGLLPTVRMLAAKLVRPLRSRWHRRQVIRHPYDVSRDALAAALGVSPGELSSVVEKMRVAFPARLPVATVDGEAIRALYREQAPEQLASTIASADRICTHVLDLLGSGPVALGDSIDWHRDFKSGHRWDPSLLFLDIPHGHGGGVDIKVPWELSRGHHLVVLAQAALLTGDVKYARECVAQMAGWIEANPAGYGVNWACPMDVAIRAVNWLWALALVVESPAASETWLADVLASLVAHGRYLFANLEVRDDGITTNHYLSDVVGLLYLGLCLKDMREADEWRSFAVGELTREMERQVLPDGVHYESSLSYHRLVTEMFLSSAVLCRHHGVDLPPAFHARLEKMCEFVLSYTKPDGLAPQIGDGDNGRLHMLTGYGQCDARDHRHLLAVGGMLFARGEWQVAAGPWQMESVWFGGRGVETGAGRSAPPASAAFPDGGFYILRAQDDYALLNCNPPAAGGIGTHKHNDLLSLELHLGGEDILVDPGCFLYTSDPQAYDRFRRTAYHSTVRVDGVEQNRFIPGKLFCVHPESRPNRLSWEIGSAVERVTAEHRGYFRLSDPVRHRREVRFHEVDGSWQVIDSLSSVAGRSQSHRLEWTLTFASHCLLQPAGTGWHVVTPRQRLWLEGPVLMAGGRSLPIQPRVEQEAMAPQYGVLWPASFLRWSWEGPLPVEGTFTMTRLGAGLK